MQPGTAAASSDLTARNSPAGRVRRPARWLANALVVLGVLLLVWTVWVWRWGDPITGLYASYQQQRLRSNYARLAEQFASARLPSARSGTTTVARASRVDRAAVLGSLRADARRYRALLQAGDPVGHLVVPRLGLDAIVVNGTRHGDLVRGPGRDLRSYMPGQGELVYIAGHRTTYGAPFARIDQLRPGDRVVMVVPYARITYVVTGHRIVSADALGELRSPGREVLRLQACHPRFFATERYIVDARPLSISRIASRGQGETVSLG